MLQIKNQYTLKHILHNRLWQHLLAVMKAIFS